jgi:import receptor subunit TOM70
VPDQPLTEEQIQALGTPVSILSSLTRLRAHPSGQERKSLAATLKQKGNDAYQARKFTLAAEFYTRAIAVSPQPEPVFYSNRAACYVSMEPPQHERVVADCDEALKLDSRYLKALNRRATALEALERYEDALRGV